MILLELACSLLSEDIRGFSLSEMKMYVRIQLLPNSITEVIRKCLILRKTFEENRIEMMSVVSVPNS